MSDIVYLEMDLLEVLIIGAGPAALRLAAACCNAGLTTACVAPSPTARWVNNYGAWSDELEGLDVPEATVRMKWDSTVVHVPETIVLPRSYTHFSTPQLQQWLLQEAQQHGATLHTGTVAAVTHHSSHSTAVLQSGDMLSARIIVDASGHAGGFVRRARSGASSWQCAFGALLHVPNGHPWALNQMVLMDFRLPPSASADWQETPTFLYAMPFDRNHVFVEETSLVHSTPPSMDVLSSRLKLRLQDMDVHGASLDTERCRIRMTAPPVVHGQRIMAYGAAADMVHPATGYQLIRALHGAAPVAAAMATALQQHDPKRAALAAWDMLWPTSRRKSWALYRFGADILAGLNHAQTQLFFSTFFSLPPHQWQGFHSATQPPADVARAMTTFFLHAPSPIRGRLLNAGLSRSGASLLQAMAQA